MCVLLTLMLALVASFGCKQNQAEIDSTVNTWIQEMLVKRTPQQRAIEALQAENPDERRKSLRAVVKNDKAGDEWAVKIFSSVAENDPDPQVRCMAIKGLRRSADERAVEPLLRVLNHKDFPRKVRPPSDDVRWDATEVLAYISKLRNVPQEHIDWARRTLIRLVTEDPSRNVRICAARGLGSYRHADALTALVRTLEDRDFAVQYEAENSLERLTGRRHNYDADVWRAWLAKTDDPFSDSPDDAPENVGATEPSGPTGVQPSS